MSPGPTRVSPGEPLPLGARLTADGVNFSVWSRSATSVELLLFAAVADREARVVRLEPRTNRTFDDWHVFVPGIRAGQLYGYRVHGPWNPELGHRFDAEKVLLDPYALAIEGTKSVVVDPHAYDWEGVRPPCVDPRRRVIYELHVRGFTRHPSSGTAQRGTFAALVEKIPYLLDLGVTTIELLPVFQFDESDNRYVDPHTGARLTNYWGYNPLGFFALHSDYAGDGGNHLDEFRDLVKALHKAGIEVILDVVFNHTAESDEGGSTLSFRGIENSTYYLLDAQDRSRYANFSGTGNTLSCNQPVVRRLILDSLRHWTDVMHVDGFRFDLATVLALDTNGEPMLEPPLPWEIENDPTLSRTQLIAEPWDASGLYQVGTFPGERWLEWNGIFRDDMRRFLRGDHGLVGAVAARLLGSPDVYARRRRESLQSVNFITCHDGFTLLDLVSYERKHNEANGQENRDGTDTDWSANHGVEGPTEDPAIVALRIRQVKNAMALVLLSQGTPMLLAGDEMCRTQAGNNNAYCQDNETSWIDWGRLHTHAEVHRFVRGMIRFRHAHPSLHRRRYLAGAEVPRADGDTARVCWHGVEPDRPDWSWTARTLAFTLTGDDDVPIHVILNMHTDAVRFRLPDPRSGASWSTAIDTAAPAPLDVTDVGAETVCESLDRLVQGRSVVVLLAR